MPPRPRHNAKSLPSRTAWDRLDSKVIPQVTQVYWNSWIYLLSKTPREGNHYFWGGVRWGGSVREKTKTKQNNPWLSGVMGWGEQVEHRFSGQGGRSVWCHNGAYSSLHLCSNTAQVQHRRRTLMETRGFGSQCGKVASSMVTNADPGEARVCVGAGDWLMGNHCASYFCYEL